LAYFEFASINSVSFTNVLRNTFNLVIDTPSQSIEFAMIDQADYDGINDYVQIHGLQDASLAAERRAKKLNINPSARAGAENGTNGAAAEASDEETELQKAQKQLEDEEDEDEEDYDPGSEGESEGSGSDSEDDDEDDDDGGEDEEDDEEVEEGVEEVDDAPNVEEMEYDEPE
jgi:hypothetical protein